MSLGISWPLVCPQCGNAADLICAHDGVHARAVGGTQYGAQYGVQYGVQEHIHGRAQDRAHNRVQGIHCPAGHRFDAAKQGYVNLLVGRGSSFTPDSPQMIMARERVQIAGVFDSLSQQLTELLPNDRSPELILDAGAGTGNYLHRLLDQRPQARGIAVDLSPAGLRRAAKHARVLALGWDVWRSVPLADDSVTAILSIFAPRNAAEYARVLRPGGLAVVVTPRPGHLGQLADVGLLAQQAEKHDQLLEQMQPEWGRPHRVLRVSDTLWVEPTTAADLVFMGPAGHHRRYDQILADVESLGTSWITSDLDVTVWHR